ncbi:hypothetical protein [uncultured Brachyspira sp.]|uniref:hypothetical protein n=1 Tax=uncultured Brachyspira sp. TaxID=221953 RepID=UPI00261C5F22|nr:hypothetical protein [uncultured Brachyspira sp.]
MYKLHILILFMLSIFLLSCHKKEIISTEKETVDYRFIGTWEFINGNNKEKYTFFDNNKIVYSNDDKNAPNNNKVYTYEWKKEGNNYYYRLWDNKLDNWSDFPIKYINTNIIKIYSDFFKKSYI